MPQNEDPSLLRRVRMLQPEALAEVYDAYSPAIYAYALRLLGDSTLAEECTAETFFRLLKALQTGAGTIQNLRPYLYRVAHNWITDMYRRQPLQPLPFEESALSHSDPPLEHQVEEQWRQAEMRAALQHLTAEQRLVISLRFIEGMDQESVAEALGKPLSAVKALQHRGLQALRRMLLKDEEGFNHGNETR
ncbi:MAG: RNA polymerase sigma factor [Anaerolineales bacterium]